MSEIDNSKTTTNDEIDLVEVFKDFEAIDEDLCE